MIFIGIDLAWTYKNETGICIIDEKGQVIYLESKVFGDRDILDVIEKYKDNKMCIAIDAPLIVNNESASRPAEGEFMRDKINGHHLSVFAVSRNYMHKSYGCIRGENLMTLICSHIDGIRPGPYESKEKSVIVETFPTGICAGIFSDIYPVKYKVKSKIAYEESKYQLSRLIERIKYAEKNEKYLKGALNNLHINTLDITKREYKHIEDKVDAFLCAYAMYLISRGLAKQKVYGNIDEGFISIAFVEKGSSNYMEKINKKDHTEVKSSLNSDDIVELVSSIGDVSKTIDDSKDKQLEALNNLILEIQVIKKKLMD